MQFAPGSCLDDRYEILRLIGTGGMGEVYQARDRRLGREVAIKVLPERLAGDVDALRRFEMEARILAALSHPNIRALYDLGHGTGFHFAVMEYLEGQTLRRRLEQGPLPLAEALRVGELLAEGLAAAHAKGVIHRDLKPENVFFTADGQVKILDFGLARLVAGESLAHLQTDGTLETQPGLIMGTVGYMAPEQVRGQALDGRCDLFAFGCVLFEMLMNQRPFQGETVPEVLAGILKDPCPRVQGPPELQRFLASCLEKDLFHRLQSAREAAAALRQLRGLPAGGSATDATAPIKTLDPNSAELPTQALPSTLASSSTSLRATQSFWQRLAEFWPFRSRTIDAVAVLPFHSSRGDAEAEYLAEGLTEGLIERLSQLPGMRVAPWSAVARLRGADLDLQDVGRRLRVQAILTGRVSHRGQEVAVSAELLDVRTLSHLWGEQYQRAFSALMEVQQELCTRIAARLRSRVSGEVRERLAELPTENPQAYRLYLKGRHAWRMRSADGLRQAVEAFQEALSWDPDFALAYAGLADAYTLLSFLVGVIAPQDAMPQARAAAKRALQLRPDLAEAHASMGMILESFEWDWTAAEASHRKALQLSPDNPNLHHRYGMHLLYRGRFEESAAAFAGAMRLDPLSPIIQVAQGLPAHFGRRPEEAIRAFRQTVTLTPQFLIAHLMLGLALVQAGKLDEAIGAFGQARSLAETPDGLAMLGHAFAAAGRREEAEGVLTRLAELGASRYVNDYGPATIRLALGDREGALQCLARAVDRRCELLVYLGIDPRLDPLRGDARFEALRAKVGLAT